jgi:glutathione synthase/RimK-type ligase-like ATP-grasp enzyme
MALDVALASCVSLPEPDADMAPLLAALRAAGLSAEAMGWDDAEAFATFAAARVVLLRSTWNYSLRPGDFLDWIERTARATRFFNAAETIRWNAHKSYLLDLQARGVPTVPTTLLRRGDATPLRDVMRVHGASRVVVKPAVSGGSRETMRVEAATLDAGEAHLRKLAAREDVLVQPYLDSVEGHGERALVWIDGELTHAVRKSPRFIGDEERVSPAVPIADDEAAVARAALAVAPTPLLYARIDVARDANGAPRVMELELIEPSLFFAQGPAALARLVAALRRQLGP